MPRTNNCEIFILAGGLSTRMGRDKSRLRLGGRTMLQHIRSVAGQTGLPVRIIRRDVVPRCGPLGGIYTALKRSRAESVLMLACDMPFVTAASLNRMLQKWEQSEKGARTALSARTGWQQNLRTRLSALQAKRQLPKTPIALFAFSGGPVGFPFLLRRETALPIVLRQIESGQHSLQSLAKALCAKTFRAPKRQLANINTPGEFAEASRRITRVVGRAYPRAGRARSPSAPKSVKRRAAESPPYQDGSRVRSPNNIRHKPRRND